MTSDRGLRKRITYSAESRYENGTITATDLLNETGKAGLINHEIHKINWLWHRLIIII